MIRSVVFDVGETLIDETRIFGRWADRLGVPRLAFFGTLGGVLAEGRPMLDAFRLVKPDFDLEAELEAWQRDEPHSLRENFDEADLYPDARPTLERLRGLGLRVIIAGNQPPQAADALRAMDLPAEGIYVSAQWGVAKPEREFFTRVIDVAGVPAEEILYVGDRVDNGSAGIQYVVKDTPMVEAKAKHRGGIAVETPLNKLAGFDLVTIWLNDPDGVTNYFAQVGPNSRTARQARAGN